MFTQTLKHFPQPCASGELPGVGVFGTGVAVRCIVPILKNCGFKVEAIWGKTQDSASDCAKDLGIQFHTTKVDQILLHKSVDLVLINCPPLLQSPIAVKALGIGKHVICGTPATPNQLDAFKLVRSSDYYPSLLAIVSNGYRYLPCFTKMKQLINDGYLGDVLITEIRVQCNSLLKTSFDWLCDSAMGGGSLNIHGGLMLDLLLFLTGLKAKWVQGSTKTLIKQTDKINGIRQIISDDFCSFHLEFPNDSLATVTINTHASNQYQHEVLVCGSKGRLVARGCDLFGVKMDSNKEEVLHRDAPCILDNQDSAVMETISADLPVPLMKGLINLIDSIRESFISLEEKHSFNPVALGNPSSFHDNLYIQAVIEAVRKSNASKKWVKVEPMKEEPQLSIMITDNIKKNKDNYY